MKATVCTKRALLLLLAVVSLADARTRLRDPIVYGLFFGEQQGRAIGLAGKRFPTARALETEAKFAALNEKYPAHWTREVWVKRYTDGYRAGAIVGWAKGQRERAHLAKRPWLSEEPNVIVHAPQPRPAR